MATSTKPAKGMRDLLPRQMLRRERVIDTVKSVYRSFGFEPLETPACERLEVLLGKYGEEGDQLVFKIMHRGEKSSARSRPERRSRTTSRTWRCGTT
ncbi:MAG: ATP phosphoribosyltransferase regulatory subunit [Blastocatellia bacterium]|nr:ATP phosphoribosyltransferase regulatory subunit [Blastocatellia bacterium]